MENGARTERQWLALVGFVGLCLLAGAVGGGITAASVKGWYATQVRPPGTPPDWVFGPVWTTLYVMMGTAAWRVWRRPDVAGVRVGQGQAMRLWGWQLLANALWTPAFFGLHSPALGLAVILVLLSLIGRTIAAFAWHDRVAAGLLVPYALWSCYATYLNAGFLWLNPG
jgi:tryptophan-rich sensory protein